MQTSLIITLLANDRTGLVAQLSELLQQHKANWEQSSMSSLDGRFAGLVRATLPKSNEAQLVSALEVLHDANNGIHVLVETGEDSPVELAQIIEITVLAQDRVGLLQTISSYLQQQKVSILSLSTEQVEASMSGGTHFYAALELGLPTGVDIDSTIEGLEALPDGLVVDLIEE